MSGRDPAWDSAAQLLEEHLIELAKYQTTTDYLAAVLVAALQQHPEILRTLLAEADAT